MTAVIAPGPAISGKAIGMIPVPLNSFSIFLSSPCLIISRDTMNKRVPPATIKLFIVMPNIDNISIPAIPNIINKIADVTAAVFDIAFRVWVSIFLVILIKIGIIPKGSTTANNWIVDAKILVVKSFGIKNNPDRDDRVSGLLNKYYLICILY